MTPLEHNFHCWAFSGICDVCGNHTSVMEDMITLQRKCFKCLVKEDCAYKEREKQRKRIPLDLEDFCK